MGLNTQIHLAVDAHGLLVRIVITEGPRADCTQAGRLIEGINADHLIADKGYDTDAILEQATAQGMNAVIPPKKNRVTPRSYDEDLYKLRHLVENAFLSLKRWRGIATRYAKSTISFSSPFKSGVSPFGPVSRSYSIYQNPDRRINGYHAA